MNDLPRPLLPEGFKPVIPTVSLSFRDESDVKPMTPIESLQRFINEIAEGICKVVRSIANWFNSPQVRRFLQCLTEAAKKAGLVNDSRVAPRPKRVSAKRAMIYQRKIALTILDGSAILAKAETP